MPPPSCAPQDKEHHKDGNPKKRTRKKSNPSVSQQTPPKRVTQRGDKGGKGGGKKGGKGGGGAVEPDGPMTAPGAYTGPASISIANVEEKLVTMIKAIVKESFNLELTDKEVSIQKVGLDKAAFGDYQCNAAMGLAKKVGSNPREVPSCFVFFAAIILGFYILLFFLCSMHQAESAATRLTDCRWPRRSWRSWRRRPLGCSSSRPPLDRASSTSSTYCQDAGNASCLNVQN